MICSPNELNDCKKVIRVLLVDDEASSLGRIHDFLSQASIDIQLECVTTHAAAIAEFAGSAFDVGLIDSPRGNSADFLAEASSVSCGFPLVVFTSDSAREVLAAMQAGAADCVLRSQLDVAALERAICLAIERSALANWHAENELRYLGLIENANDIIYTHDLAGNYTSANRAVTKVTGYTREEALKLNLTQVIAPEFLERSKEKLARKVEEQSQTIYEVEILTKEGERVPVEISTHLIYKNGKPVAVQGIARDLTTRREAESALREREEAYRELFENANDIVYTYDLQGNFTSLNRAGEEITGYSRHEVVHLNVADVVVPEHLPVVKERLSNYSLEGRRNPIQLDLIRKDGKRLRLEVNGRPIIKDGVAIGFQGIARDVTERHNSEEALRASEQLYRQIINEASESIYRLDINGHFTFVNPVGARYLRSSAEELVGRSFADFVRPDYRELLQKFYQQQIAEQIPTTYLEFPTVANDGTEMWVGQNLQLIMHEDHVVEMQAVARDITERKVMEETLRRSQERYRAFVEHSAEAIWCVELEQPCPIDIPEEEQIDHLYAHGYLGECNDVMAQMYGYAVAGELNGTRMSNLIPRHDPANVAYLKRFISSGYRLANAESQEPDPEGHAKYYLNNLVGIVEKGAVVRVWGTQRDITPTKRAAEEVRAANERALADYERLLERIARLGQSLGQARDLTTILRAVRDFAVLSLPCDGMVITLYDHEKQTRRAVFCWADGEEFDVSELENIPVREGTTGRALKTGEIVIENDFLNALNGRSVTIGDCTTGKAPRSALSAPMAVMGRVVGCIEIQSYLLNAYSHEHTTAMRMAANLAANAVENVDLIKRERAKADQLRQSQKMEAVGQLAGGVAHDFNNLLTAITGYSDLTLRRLPADDPLRKNVEEIKRAGARAASLTRQLLAFSRKQMLQAKVLDLNSIVSDMDKMLRRLIGEDIDLATLLQPSLPPIKADPGQIEQVILNLAVNARDAMPTGGKLTIETGAVTLTETEAGSGGSVKPGRYVLLAVSDNGGGMSQETRQRIFEPFFTTKEVGKGTGLGLSTVYGIIKQSGGNVGVYSELGQGSTFKVYLPVAEEAAGFNDAKTSPAEIPQGTETILLVEDEEMVRNLTREILQTCGYHVLSAKNGREADEVCRAFNGEIELMITDVVMPQMGGRELAERVAEVRPETRVLYMSGYTDDAIVRHGVLDEEMPFLQKPFSPEALAKKVKEVLESAAAPIAA